MLKLQDTIYVSTGLNGSRSEPNSAMLALVGIEKSITDKSAPLKWSQVYELDFVSLSSCVAVIPNDNSTLGRRIRFRASQARGLVLFCLFRCFLPARRTTFVILLDKLIPRLTERSTLARPQLNLRLIHAACLCLECILMPAVAATTEIEVSILLLYCILRPRVGFLAV